MTVERLDFSNLPLGYSKCLHRTGWSLLHGDKELGFYQARSAIYDLTKDAWAHYKACHDPPGIEVFSDDGAEEHWCFAARDTAALCDSPHGSRNGARAAAWAWYEDAIEVADLLDGENGPAEFWPDDFSWPQPLTWTSERRAKVRTLCLNGGDWSEVLRG